MVVEREWDLDYISSRKNPYLALVNSLTDRKGREKERLFRFDGIKLFREATACGVEIEKVLICEPRADKLLREVAEILSKEELKRRVTVLSEGAFAKISEEKSPEGIITVAKYIDKRRKIATISNVAELALSEKKLLALESVRDPGNVGTVIRTAAAFGIDALLMSADCADIYNPRTVRAAMGALFSRDIYICNDMPRILRVLSENGRRTLGAALSDRSVPFGEAGIVSTDCIVIGNEGHGLSGAVIDACDGCVILPMEQGPGVESLNAAIAASVFMWEIAGRNCGN